MPKCLVVVADGSRARLFESGGIGTRLVEREDLSHPESRLHARELTADLPGTSFDRTGRGRHSMEPSTDPKRVEIKDFAHTLAARVEAARAREGVQQVVLVAPPRFLGLLREGLSEQSRRLVVREVVRDIVTQKSARIAEVIDEKN